MRGLPPLVGILLGLSWATAGHAQAPPAPAASPTADEAPAPARSAPSPPPPPAPPYLPAPAAQAYPAPPSPAPWVRVGPPVEDDRAGAKKALATTGGALAGLGLTTVVIGSVFWLVAAVDAAQLDDECPNKTCVEGSRGADSLERARDASTAADWLVGAGVLAGGTGALLLFTAWGVGGNRAALRTSPSVGPHHAGVTLQGAF